LSDGSVTGSKGSSRVKPR